MVSSKTQPSSKTAKSSKALETKSAKTKAHKQEDTQATDHTSNVNEQEKQPKGKSSKLSKSVSTKSSKAKGAHHEIDINDAKAKKVTPNDANKSSKY